LLANVVQIVFQIAELAEQSSALARLLVRESLRVLQLCGKRNLNLRELADLRLGFLQLAQQIAVLDRQFLLRGIEVVQSTIDLLKLALGFVQLVLQLLDDLLLGGLYFKENYTDRFYINANIFKLSSSLNNYN